MGIALHLRFSFFVRQGRGVLNTPYQASPTRGRTSVPGCVAGQFIGVIRALSFPIRGRMLLRPYASGSCFLSIRVGAYCIRPIKRPRQEDEHPYPVQPTIIQRQPPGPYRARLWGVCNTPLHLRSIVWDHFTNRPYTSDSCFLSEWVGAYGIRPTRRPRKGDECGFLVVLLGD